MMNAIGRQLPEYIDSYGRIVPFGGVYHLTGHATAHITHKTVRPDASKLVDDIRDVFERIPIRRHDVSSHHYLRDGQRGVLTIQTGSRDGLAGCTTVVVTRELNRFFAGVEFEEEFSEQFWACS